MKQPTENFPEKIFQITNDFIPRNQISINSNSADCKLSHNTQTRRAFQSIRQAKKAIGQTPGITPSSAGPDGPLDDR